MVYVYNVNVYQNCNIICSTLSLFSLLVAMPCVGMLAVCTVLCCVDESCHCYSVVSRASIPVVSGVRGLLQIFDQRLDNLDSTINQLESTGQQLLDAGYLSDEDTGKRQVCAAAADDDDDDDEFSCDRKSQLMLSLKTCCTE